MRYFIIAIIVLVNFLIKSTILHHISVFGVVPNTSLIIIVCLSLLAGKKTGSVLGLILGLLEDMFFYEVIGVHALIYFIIGYLIGLTDKKVFKENLFLPFVFTVLSTFAFHVVYYVFMYFLSINVDFISLLKDIVIIETILNSVLSVFFYKQFLKLYRQPQISFGKK
ncbi:rod shape-determining protein MreD [Proteiniborus sp. MB09-C3]|uniref:rod shape-determining protein MreD n=1 Tax=Proteiniborus sp. MB09-C3 TaxID=3050072 RepID=UPI0025541751|nr:rod shape-determining protein MreD [Proteiniborus sp. MB09-C3]WIV10599.1 rod shape-determining protein MreD [Proteiniborus sp. MB09-C3]